MQVCVNEKVILFCILFYTNVKCTKLLYNVHSILLRNNANRIKMHSCNASIYLQ